jgi:molybdenum cofactor synthesis domain-containing protein
MESRTRDVTIEIIAIGTELVMGRIQDTNTFWMEQRIIALGGHVRRAVMVEDSREEILDVLRNAVARHTDLVITTGGLGPTPDDLTAACLAELVGTTAVPHGPTLDEFVLRRNFKSREELTPNLVRMATVPQTATILSNPIGWAPCVALNIGNGSGHTRVFAVPGPPNEMQGVFTAHIAPAIAEASGICRIAERVTIDMWESEASPLMQEVMARFPGSFLKGYIAMRTAAEDRLPVDVVVAHSDPVAATTTLHAAVNLFEELLLAKGKTLEREN